MPKKPTKRIIELEVHEQSLVDMPAIGEEFVVVKSMKGDQMLLNKETILKSRTWLSDITKDVATEEPCVFCEEKGGRDPKIGLKCGVCFSCAMDRIDKGVFDQCIEGSFDFEKFKAQYPDEFLESDTKTLTSRDQILPQNLKDGSSKSLEGDGAMDLEKRIQELSKGMSDLKTLLEQSLSLHDEAARALNQIVELNVMALEQMATMSGDESNSAEEDVSVQQRKSLLADITKNKPEITKIGAKISTARLNMLRDISQKLSELIQSVMTEKKSKLKTVKEAESNLSAQVKSCETQLESMKNDTSNKIDSLAKRLNDIENTAGLSGAIEEDEGGQEEKNNEDKQKSIFAPLIGLDEIKMQVAKRNAYLAKGPKS